jgi:hypothetical protein
MNLQMDKVLSFSVTQPSDGVTFEHIVGFKDRDVYGGENIKSVDDTISLNTLLRTIVNSPENSGSQGPYSWHWISR